MNRIKFICNLALLGLMAFGATSCEDWLTIYPQDKVVEEDFWEDKNDLDGVRYKAYSQMASNLERFVIWGDLRSDSYELNNSLTSGTGTRDTYDKIRLGQPDSTMSLYDWGGVYTVINYCNKVLSEGEKVLANDAQFLPTEWAEMKSEVTALRAFNYFYLLRAFKDIPYTTTTVSSDKDVKIFQYTNQLVVLDSIINDCERVAGHAKNRFESINVGGINSKADSKGLITNTAIYALLADMYLWRSALHEGRNKDSIEWWQDDARKAIEYSQKSIDALAYQERQASSGYGGYMEETEDFGLSANYGIHNCNLIDNKELTVEYNNKREYLSIPSYSSIFGGTNASNACSSESIFELTFWNPDKRSTGIYNSMWGYGDGSQLVACNKAISLIYGSDDSKKDRDSRTWYSANVKIAGEPVDRNQPNCLKYLKCNFIYQDGKVRANPGGDGYSNWIFYRLTDVMLIQAEAYAVLFDDDSKKKCKAIVDAIHKRSTIGQEGVNTPSNNRDEYIKMVMNERQIELLGEGKRWFDLVRWAERRGGGVNPDPREPEYVDGAQGVQDMVETFMSSPLKTSDKNALKSRLKNRYGLYSPIYYMEIKASKYQIDQNPVWKREKDY